jgi:hypothetical protein
VRVLPAIADTRKLVGEPGSPALNTETHTVTGGVEPLAFVARYVNESRPEKPVSGTYTTLPSV